MKVKEWIDVARQGRIKDESSPQAVAGFHAVVGNRLTDGENRRGTHRSMRILVKEVVGILP